MNIIVNVTSSMKGFVTKLIIIDNFYSVKLCVILALIILISR